MTAFRAIPYTLPLATRYRWAKGDHDTRSGILIRAEIDGAVGWGEVAYGPHVVRDWTALAADLERAAQGVDPGGEVAQLDALNLHNRDRAGFATAWLAAQAAARGISLAAHLAAPGQTPATRVPINGLVNKDAPEDAVAQAQAYADQGMTTLKIKCFADVARDLERVRALRAAFPGFAFRLDPNDAWPDVDAALRNMEAFAPPAIDYVEDPLDTKTATLDDMARLKRADPAIAVAWDNPVEGLAEMQALLDRDAVDVFIFKMPRAGGPDRQAAMIRVAAEAGKPAVMTGPIETAIGTMAGHHLAALLPEPIPHCGFSLSQHFARDIADLAPITDGTRALPDAPGLGLEPDLSRA